jgi:hypothetical protein
MDSMSCRQVRRELLGLLPCLTTKHVRVLRDAAEFWVASGPEELTRLPALRFLSAVVEDGGVS